MTRNTTEKTGVKIAALGDLHVREHASESYSLLLNRMAEEADVLVFCGDLTNLGLPTEAKLFAKEVHDIRIPMLGVLGNHDHQSGKESEVRQILKSAGVVFLDEEPFECNDVGFVGTKGFIGGFEKYMLGSFGEPAIKQFVAEAVNESLLLENMLRTVPTEKIVAVLHYSPIRETIDGEPLEIYPFLGSSRLAEVIDRFPVSAVFHGHAHAGKMEGKTPKGIPVYNAAHELRKQKTPEQPFALVTISG